MNSKLQLKDIVTIVCFLIAVAIVATLVFPKYQEVSRLNQKIERAKREIADREKQLNSMKEITEKITQYQDQFSQIEAALPQYPSVPVLFNFMKKTTEDNGLVLKKLSLGGEKTGEEQKTRVEKIDFKISVAGSYPAFKNFLSAIQSNVRLIEVKNLNFSSPSKERPFEFRLQMRTHSY